jgi:hypothetical protein
MILGEIRFPSSTNPGYFTLSFVEMILISITISSFWFRYNIRREKGLLRDPKTGIVGPNRKQIRYTELADEMVEKLGRLGQKTKKVRRSVLLHVVNLTRV